MRDEDIDLTLREVFATVLGVDADGISDETSPSTMHEWTSLRHLSLVAAAEEAFSIHLSIEDIYASQTFGALRGVVSRHVVRTPKRSSV
jgi:acyl carrier protein